MAAEKIACIVCETEGKELFVIYTGDSKSPQSNGLLNISEGSGFAYLCSQSCLIEWSSCPTFPNYQKEEESSEESEIDEPEEDEFVEHDDEKEESEEEIGVSDVGSDDEKSECVPEDDTIFDLSTITQERPKRSTRTKKVIISDEPDDED